MRSDEREEEETTVRIKVKAKKAVGVFSEAITSNSPVSSQSVNKDLDIEASQAHDIIITLI